jgi:peroxiredoxin
MSLTSSPDRPLGAPPLRRAFTGASVLSLAASIAAALDPAPLPPFPLTLPVLEDGHDRPVDLNRMFAGRGVLLVFYFGGWSEACVAGLRMLEANREALARAGYGAVGVSPEAAERLAATAARNGLGLPTVHDHMSRFAASLGLAFRPTGTERADLRAAQVRLAAWNGETTTQLPLPATLLVEADRRARTFLHVDGPEPRGDIPAAIRAALG